MPSCSAYNIAGGLPMYLSREKQEDHHTLEFRPVCPGSGYISCHTSPPSNQILFVFSGQEASHRGPLQRPASLAGQLHIDPTWYLTSASQ